MTGQRVSFAIPEGGVEEIRGARSELFYLKGLYIF